jgi:4-hydroxy-3-methylbut-2-enyl diphosphate reductase
MEQTYFRKGLGLKSEVADALESDYHSGVVDLMQEQGYQLSAAGLTFKLAHEFGFCYGVDRAVDNAYQTRTKFPDKAIHLVGEIIHNPHVNAKLERMDINILRPAPSDGAFDFSHITARDVVIIPAFGVTVSDMLTLNDSGCVLIDTTCGSVLNVWKRVEKYAKDGFTALIHGKHFHEESKATASQVSRYDEGKYIIVRDMAETEIVCDFIEHGGDTSAIEERFAVATSRGFNAAEDLIRIGVANQTTMLANESLAIADRVRQSMVTRYGADALPDHFRSFDTICSATQERQDAILELIKDPLDVMIVIGGYNSSNTSNLARICAEKIPTYHIADASCIDPSSGVIRHKPVNSTEETAVPAWLGDDVSIVGITAGASTPNNKIGEAVERIVQTRGGELEKSE